MPPRQAAQLTALLQEAARTGHPIRVALIASSTDLGSVTELWRQPQFYAQFLGQELSLVYRGPLLVVMPSGFGVYHFAHATRVERAIHASPNPTAGIGQAALTAVRTVAAAAGHPLAVPAAGNPETGAPGNTAPTWIVFIAGVILVAAAWTASLRARPLKLARRKPTST
jgi:hypothetical protein